MRFMISVAFMPCPIACNIDPICHQPDFIRHVRWAEDIHPDKPCGTVDKVRTPNESPLDLGIHFIGHDKSAQDANRLLFQLSNSSRKNVFSEFTPTDGRQGYFPSQQRFGRLIMPPEKVLSSVFFPAAKYVTPLAKKPVQIRTDDDKRKRSA